MLWVLHLCVSLSLEFSSSTKDIEPPKYVHIVDENDKPIESVSIQKYAPIDTIYCKSNGTDVKWSISPQLPAGLRWYSSFGTIRGSPEEVFPATVFTVVASNAAGNATGTFTLEVLGCKYGDYLLPRIYGVQKGTLEISQEGTLLYSFPISRDEFTALCIPQGMYSYVFNCTSSPVKPFRCSFQLEDEHFNYYFSLYSLLAEPVSGTFETKATKKPAISMTYVIAAYPGKRVHEYIEVIGLRSNITVTPDLPKTLSIDQTLSALIGTVGEAGVTTYTVSVANQLGDASFVFSIGVDACPDEFELIVFRRKTNTVFDKIQFSDSQGNMLFDNDFTYENPVFNFCLKEGAYIFHFAYDNPKGYGWDEHDPLMIYEGDQLMSNFLLDNEISEETRHFHYSIPVKKGSSFRYSREYINKWNTLKLNDMNWKEASEGHWGSFDKSFSSLYLRRTLSLSSLENYSFVHIDVKTSEMITVYLNEHTWFRSQPLFNYTRFTFTLDGLKEGLNLLAIELTHSGSSSIELTHSGSSSIELTQSTPIDFDLRIQLVTSGCLLQSIQGNATDSQPHPSSYYPVERAFDLNLQTFWNIYSYPTTVRYTFEGESRHVMNTLMIMNTKNDYPTSLRIQAVEGDQIIDLYSYASKTFMMKGEFQYLTFENTRAYSAYQVVFEQSLYNKTTTVHDMRFLACNPIVCNKRWSLPRSVMGSVVSKSCSLFQVGSKQVKCRNVDNQPKWVEDTSGCIPKYPQKGISFLDWSIRLFNVTIDSQKEIETAMTLLITKNLRVQEEEIGYVSIRDTSTSDITIVDVDIRFTFELEIGDYILKHVNKVGSRFNELVKTYFKDVSTDISGEVVGKPVLHTPIQVALIVSLGIGGIILVCILIYLYVRLRTTSPQRKLRKTLTKEENQTLLSKVYSVCKKQYY